MRDGMTGWRLAVGATVIVGATLAGGAAVSAATQDPDFGTVGLVLLEQPDQRSEDIAAMSDGRLLVTTYDDDDRVRLYRLLVGGDLDTSFSNDGIVPLGQVRGGAVALDGSRPVVAFVRGPFPSRSVVVRRFTAAGRADTSFGDRGTAVVTLPPVAGSAVTDVHVTTDGRVVVTGLVENDRARAFAVRLTGRGELDTTFSRDGVALPRADRDVVITSSAVDGLGRVYLAGTRYATERQTDPYVVRLTATGVADPTYGSAGEWTARIQQGGQATVADIRILRQGRVALLVQVEPPGSDDVASSMMRLTAGGAVDTGFGVNGIRGLPFSGYTRVLPLAVVPAAGSDLRAVVELGGGLIGLVTVDRSGSVSAASRTTIQMLTDVGALQNAVSAPNGRVALAGYQVDGAVTVAAVARISGL